MACTLEFRKLYAP